MSTEAHAQVHRTVEPRWLRFHGAWRGAAGSSRRSRAREVKTSVKFSADSSSAPWTGSTDKGPEREDRPRVRGEERHQRRGKGTVNPPARSTHHGNARARATWHPPRGRGFRFLARAAAIERNDEPAGRRVRASVPPSVVRFPVGRGSPAPGRTDCKSVVSVAGAWRRYRPWFDGRMLQAAAVLWIDWIASPGGGLDHVTLRSPFQNCKSAPRCLSP
jgi:hypothetical protein